MAHEEHAVVMEPVATAGASHGQAILEQEPAKIEAADLSFYYGDKQALKRVSIRMMPKEVTALIGPSGCGKSTFLRCINRMNDRIAGTRVEGQVRVDGFDVYAPDVDPVVLRKRIGMVFQKPNPFPHSVYDNVAYGPRISGVRSRRILDEVVERSLRRAALWEEVKDKLRQSALALSGGQQQRLCIARVLAMEPDVLLMDEPCSALDPAATLRVEQLMSELKRTYTIVIVTHNMQQAARVSDRTGFFLEGELIEFDATATVFQNPADQRTEAYISGRFG
jgi:phosphate transport system ATP-binding protein